MFKSALTSLALAATVVGALAASSTTASAHKILIPPHGFPIHGGFHPVLPTGGIHPIGGVYPIGGWHPIHPIGPIVDPIHPWPGHGHHPHGPGFGITIVDDGYYASSSVSCGTAKAIVRSNGFHAVQAQDCVGGVYSFTGLKHGAAFSIDVSNHGRILGVDRI